MESSPATHTELPSPARMYDYMLGGDHNTEVDRAAVNQLPWSWDELVTGAWTNRGFVQRVARWLSHDAGIDQIVDIGAGLPTVQNTHEIVRSDCRVVYVDHEERAVQEGRKLLETAGFGDRVRYIHGDVRDLDLLDRPEVRALIDPNRPVALMMIGLLYFIPDSDDPYGLVSRLVDRLPSGSYVAISHLIRDHWVQAPLDDAEQVYRQTDDGLTYRWFSDVERFVEGMDIVPPYANAPARVDYIGLWGAEDTDSSDDDYSRAFAAVVARKP